MEDSDRKSWLYVFYTCIPVPGFLLDRDRERQNDSQSDRQRQWKQWKRKDTALTELQEEFGREWDRQKETEGRMMKLVLTTLADKPINSTLTGQNSCKARITGTAFFFHLPLSERVTLTHHKSHMTFPCLVFVSVGTLRLWSVRFAFANIAGCFVLRGRFIIMMPLPVCK